MITDIHTHFVKPGALGPRVLDDMRRCGIRPDIWEFDELAYLAATAAADRAVVFGLKAHKTGWLGDNETVAEFVSRNGPKYVFFASIDPSEPVFRDELKYCQTVLGCRGIKLGPIYQGIHPHDPRYYDIYAFCERHGLPIVTHMAATFSSGVSLEYARPALMDRVACDFPDLKIILAHLGHPWIEEAIVAVRKQPGLYADISALYYRPWQFYNAMRLLEEYGAAGKVFFGSDFPACTTQSSIDGLKSVNETIEGTKLPRVSESVIDQILNSDPLSELGIGK